MPTHQPQGKSLSIMISAPEGTLGVGALTLVLAVVLVGCGGGGGRQVRS
jgi:hypothetical protein